MGERPQRNKSAAVSTAGFRLRWLVFLYALHRRELSVHTLSAKVLCGELFHLGAEVRLTPALPLQRKPFANVTSLMRLITEAKGAEP
jgi:hypothetical protein